MVGGPNLQDLDCGRLLVLYIDVLLEFSSIRYALHLINTEIKSMLGFKHDISNPSGVNTMAIDTYVYK